MTNYAFHFQKRYQLILEKSKHKPAATHTVQCHRTCILYNVQVTCNENILSIQLPTGDFHLGFQVECRELAD